MLASGSDDRSIEALADGRLDEAGRLHRRQQGGPLALGFSPDGTRLATGGGQGVVKIWPTAPVGEAQICAEIAAEVTGSELRDELGDGIQPQACTNLTG